LKIPRVRDLALAAATAGALILACGPSAAASLRNPTFSGGAVGVTGGGYRLAGTIGEAGVVGRVTGSGYALLEGFWHPGAGFTSAVDQDPQVPVGDDATFANAPAGNHPNPFNGATVIAFSVARPTGVTLGVFDLAGRRGTGAACRPSGQDRGSPGAGRSRAALTCGPRRVCAGDGTIRLFRAARPDLHLHLEPLVAVTPLGPVVVQGADVPNGFPPGVGGQPRLQLLHALADAMEPVAALQAQ
jgi:hypothetical protein